MGLSTLLRSWASISRHSSGSTPKKLRRDKASNRFSDAIRCGVEALETRTLLTATPLYWDTSSDAGLQGGNGIWSTTVLNWNTAADGSGTKVAWTNGDDAVFSAGAGSVSISSTVTADSLSFQANGYTLAGGTLSFAGGSGDVDVEDGENATINSVIAGSTSQLNVVDSGTLLLTAANTYSGGTTVSAGTLALGGSGKLGSTSGRLVVNGSLDLGGTSQTVASLSGSGTILNTAAYRFSSMYSSLAVNGGTTTYAGAITGPINLNVAGAADLTLTGDISLSSGGLGTGSEVAALSINGGSATLSGTAAVYNGGTLDVSDAALTVAGSGGLTNFGTVTIDGGGTIEVDGGNQYQYGEPENPGMAEPYIYNEGTWNVNDGTLICATALWLEDDLNINAAGKLVVDDGGSINTCDGFDVQNYGTMEFDTSPGDWLGAPISNSGNIIFETSAEIGSYGFGGQSEVAAGVTLTLDGGVPMGTVQVDAGGTLTANGDSGDPVCVNLNLDGGDALIYGGFAGAIGISGGGGYLGVDPAASVSGTVSINIGSNFSGYLPGASQFGSVYFSQSVDLSGVELPDASGNGCTYSFAGSATVDAGSALTIDSGAELDVVNGSLTVGSGATLDNQGTLVISSGNLTIDGGSLIVESGAQLNISSDSTVAFPDGGTDQIEGALAVNGGGIVTQAIGYSSMTSGGLYYSFDLARQYYNSEPIMVTDWTVDWGDGSWDDYPVTNTTPAIIASHPYATDWTGTPTIEISALTAEYGGIAPLNLVLPPTLLDGSPPAPVNLAATESTAGEVDLTWSYDTNLAANFTLTVTDPYGGSTSHTIGSGVPGALTYDVTGLTADENYTFSLVADVPQAGGETTQSEATTITTAASDATLSTAGPPSIVDSGSGGTLSLSFGAATDITGWSVAWTDENGVPIRTDPVDIGINQDAYPTPPSGATGLVATVTATDLNGYSFTLPAFYVEVLPVPPSSVTASVSGGSVTLNWTENDSAFAAYYNVYASDGGGYSEIDSVDGSQLSDSLFGLNPSTPYTFEVTAMNAVGDESTMSTATASITSPALPAVPSGLTASLSAGNVVLNWNGDSTLATGYNIYMSTGDGAPFDYFDSVDAGTATTYTASPADGSDYQWEVTAEDASGETASSGSVDQAVPLPPQNLAVALSGDATSATITWTAPDALATGYIITRTPDDGSTGPQTVGAEILNSGSEYNCIDTGLDATEAYTYAVTATYRAGTGPAATTDTYTGNAYDFTTVLAANGTTANLTWLYQGSDSFEVEELDTGAAGSNYFIIYVGSGRNCSSPPLSLGDTYDFRIRVDHVDGSVSNYYSGEPVDVPIQTAPTIPPTLSPPSASIESVNGTTPGVWYGTFSVTSGYDASDAGSGPTSLHPSRLDDSYHIMNDGSIEYAVDSNSFVFGTTGATYNVTFSTTGVAGGVFANQYSGPSQPVTITLQGTLPPALTLQAGPVGSGIVTWAAPAGITVGTVSFYQVVTQNGQQVALPVSATGSTNVLAGQATLSVPSPQETVFAVYGGRGSAVDAGYNFIMAGVSPYSNQVQVACTVPPAAPSDAVANWGVPNEDGVFLHWADDSDDETGFDIYRYPAGTTFNPSTATFLNCASADATTYDDANAPTNQNLIYAVVAVDAAGRSQPTTAPTEGDQEYIALLQGDNTTGWGCWDPCVNAFHETVAGGHYENGAFVVDDGYSFGGTNPGQTEDIQAKNNWLWWNQNIAAGHYSVGEVYETKIFTKVVETKKVTMQQETEWNNQMKANKQQHPTDVFSPLWFNCRMFSQRAYADAPGN